MTFDSVTGWEVIPYGAFANPEKAAVWDESVWDEYLWNEATSAEIWVPLACQTMNADLRYGASSINGVLTRYEAATLALELWDPERLFDPFNPNGYHAFGVGRLRIRARVKLEARHVSAPATVYQLFNGFVEALEFDWLERKARIVASDGVGFLAKYDSAAVDPPVGDGETAAARMTRLLDLASWPIADRDIQSGGYQLQATKLEGSAWEEMLRAAEADLGLLTVKPDGIVQYVPQERLPWTGDALATIGTGTGVAITGAVGSEDDANIANDVGAMIAGGTTTYRYQDAQSAAYFGFPGQPVYYALSRTDLPLKNEIDASSWAQTVLSVNAWPEARFSPFQVRLSENGALISSPSAWQLVAGIRIGQRWRVICTPVDLDTEMHIRGWTFGIFRDDHSLEWNASIVTTSAAWNTPMIWDDDRFGMWDEFRWG